jgi:hypothetical protein
MPANSGKLHWVHPCRCLRKAANVAVARFFLRCGNDFLSRDEKMSLYDEIYFDAGLPDVNVLSGSVFQTRSFYYACLKKYGSPKPAE